ncbi:ABC transporter substrate-binding protein [Paramicrobacterium fandaimingii]|nr:ABC transporter substrate-binding protein [Microbacterium fandaimingii]
MAGIAAATALVTALAGCTPAASGDGSNASAATERGDELTLQFRGSPMSLDPALQGTASGSIFTVLAYAPLIYQAPDGSLQPSLATSWEFTSDEMTAFEISLREGVQFTDGKALDAEAVKASMEYFLEKSGPNLSSVGPIDSVEAVDDTTVVIHYSKPFSSAPMSLTQTAMMGNIIGPDALADPESLLTTMDGAGQYTYNAEESVPGSEYVYERNPDFWNPDAQMWERVTVQIMADPNAVLSAASTGQIDFGLGSALFADAAADAGLDVAAVPFYNWELRLADTEGEINPALGDPRVREAIGLAIDRSAIVDALGGGYMAVSDQMVVEGNEGYSSDIGWDYDLDRARELLADAGYEDGFSMTVLDSGLQDADSQIAQAIASNLKKVNIDVTLEVDTVSIPSFIEKAETKKYEATIWASNGDVGNTYRGFRSTGTMTNPFGFVDDEMESMYAESLAAIGDDREAIYQKMSERWQELAYSIPVLTQHYVNYVGQDVTNVKASPANPVMLPVGPQPEYNWQPTR